jgi:GH15 family glucan-1,4-alpha-glucosidase
MTTLNTIKKGPFKGMVLIVNDHIKSKAVLWPHEAAMEIEKGARVVEEKEWDAFKTQSMIDRDTKAVAPIEAEPVAPIVEGPDFSILDLPGTRRVVKVQVSEKFYAETREFESGWGNKRDDLLEFDTAEERDAWCKAYNLKHNSEAATPAWYIKAFVLN